MLRYSRVLLFLRLRLRFLGGMDIEIGMKAGAGLYPLPAGKWLLHVSMLSCTIPRLGIRLTITVLGQVRFVHVRLQAT